LTESLPAGTSSAVADAARHQEEQAERERRLREAAVQEGAATARASYEAQLQQERRALAGALAGLAQERESYFRSVEAEVVQLALAIARKVVHREVECDPLLLAGVVRVALDKVGEQSKVTMHVHPSRVSAWHEHFFRHAGSQATEVVGDAALALDQCRVETVHGSTEIGIERQLKEIEQGFADLLARRPART
jgi:flagellar assembly protein FliH